jgi:hypothetical protein
MQRMPVFGTRDKGRHGQQRSEQRKGSRCFNRYFWGHWRCESCSACHQRCNLNTIRLHSRYKVVVFWGNGASPARADHDHQSKNSAVKSYKWGLTFGKVADFIVHDLITCGVCSSIWIVRAPPSACAGDDLCFHRRRLSKRNDYGN